MKIQGTLSIEDINLHVQIDAPDEARDVFVTNLPPHALVFTRERLRIEALGFPQEVVETLLRERIFHLNDLVSEHFELTLDRVPDALRKVVEKTLKLFLDAALIPFLGEIPEGYAAPEELQRDSAKLQRLQHMLSGTHLAELHALSPNGKHTENIDILGLPAGVTRELRDTLNVHTLDDFSAKHIGRKELQALRYMNDKILARIINGLAQHGIQLGTESLTHENSTRE